MSRPKLKPQDHDYYLFYKTLDESRGMGMSAPSGISVVDVAALCNIQGIVSVEDKSKYLRTTQVLDRAYLAHWHETQPKP